MPIGIVEYFLGQFVRHAVVIYDAPAVPAIVN